MVDISKFSKIPKAPTLNQSPAIRQFKFKHNILNCFFINFYAKFSLDTAMTDFL